VRRIQLFHGRIWSAARIAAFLFFLIPSAFPGEPRAGRRASVARAKCESEKSKAAILAALQISPPSPGRFTMAAARVAPYGSWKSPITSDLIVAATVGLEQPRLDGDDVSWIETRPAEGGRYVIVRRGPDGRTADRTPAPLNARTRVHEYGGGAYAVADGTVYFSNFADQRLYRQDRDAPPRPITPEGDLRYAAAVVDRRRGRLVCVREAPTDARD